MALVVNVLLEVKSQSVEVLPANFLPTGNEARRLSSQRVNVER